MPERPVLLVSACLLGLRSAYDLRVKPVPAPLERAIGSGAVTVVPVCPEQQGGLSTPRLPAEIRGGEGADVLEGRAVVHRIDGADVTPEFVRGAQDALALARMVRPALCVLKERSPSCGCAKIHDGTHTGTLRDGSGVAAALLRAEGYRVCSEETLERELPSALGEGGAA